MAAINGDRVHAIAVEEEGMDGNIRYCEGLHIEEGTEPPVSVAADLNSRCSRGWSFSSSLCFIQKLLAEVMGTYFMMFAGCGSVVVNLKTGTLTVLGTCIVWGLVVMAMVYSLGHVSGAHFNPAVTIAFATCKRFPWKQILVTLFVADSSSNVGACLYISSGGGIDACERNTSLPFDFKHEHYFGTIPTGSNVQSLVLEFIISFYLMFIISGIGTDNRAIREVVGIAVGGTVLLISLFAGPISGASMNPARSIGPALVMKRYERIWIYMVAPIGGTLSGAWAYNLIRFTDKPLREITKNAS
ncbi:hypothetical protein MRB53_020002 [Persea americana]|uniref:Uncharacterized protein n=1 Tax=Persea americana TaxID=3435 RepID=A0ACC2L061_PERAE|nr:hypothetical protein MRB53_020002 [Persea americana]